MKLSTKILIGLFSGIITGIFLGEYAQPLRYIGDAFIGLMQMTVMPIILISLLSNLGKIKLSEQKKLIGAAVVVLIIFLFIGLLTISILPSFFPTWDSSSFFSTNMVTPKETIDYIDVYIPSNLFKSLTNNIVPAVVIFSIIVGIGLNATPGKQKFINALDVFSSALNKANKHIVKLTPYGIFGIAANTAGTLSLGELGLIQVYIAIYTAAVLVLGLVLIPLMVTAVTPFSYKDFLSIPKSTLITIFATGKIIILLPQLIENINQLFDKYNEKDANETSSAELIMPLAYPFPNLGTLVIMVFIPFSAWFSGVELSFTEQLNFTTSALLSSFVSPVVGIPFLLDTLHLPQDIFQLFIVSTAYTDRVRVVLGAIHLFGLSVISIAYAKGLVKVNTVKLGKAALIGMASFFIILYPVKHFIGNSFQDSFDKHKTFMHMDIDLKRMPETETTPSSKKHIPNSINSIKENKKIRVGYIQDALPYVFKNDHQKMVGFDVELIHTLAYELGIGIQWIQIHRDSIENSLNGGKIDLFASGVPVLADRMMNINYSIPYSELNLALIVPDHERHYYKKIKHLFSNENAVYATNQTDYLNTLINKHIPNLKLTHISSPKPYLEGKIKVDAMFFSAEAGSAWTLVHPSYCIVKPEDLNIKLPVSWAFAKTNPELEEYISQWLELKKFDGTISRLYIKWILGDNSKSAEPRWSIIKDVLHWVK